MSKSAAEVAFREAWDAIAPDGADLVEEYRFHPERRWRFDFAWPSQRLALEIDGRGRHQTVVGTRQDCEKLNAAVALGWAVMRFPATDYRRAAEWARDVLDAMCNRAELAKATTTSLHR